MNKIKNFKAMFELENVKYLKGQGSISEGERALLAAAATTLNRNLEQGEFMRVLDIAITNLSGVSPSAGAFSQDVDDLSKYEQP